MAQRLRSAESAMQARRMSISQNSACVACCAQGLDIYRENSVLNEKLNAFFGSINNVPALRGAVQFPSLQVSASFSVL